jgi:ABC-type iron transport system FetAB ATPase subunit
MTPLLQVNPLGFKPGDTPLLKIIASLLSPTTGNILYRGEDIVELSPEAYRQLVSYCVARRYTTI